jgi:hypothetical protein
MSTLSKSIQERGVESSILAVLSAWECLLAITKVSRSTVVIVHTPLVKVMPLIIVARILRKQIFSLVWDAYPVVVGGELYDKSLRRRVLDRIENYSASLCNQSIVPSEDFVGLSAGLKPRVIKIWPQLSRTPPNRSEVNAPRKELSVIYCGQINATRGFCAAINHLLMISNVPIKVRVASADPLPPELSGKDCIEHLGFVEKEELFEILCASDFGLVSLALGFEGPGFPSKTFEYVEAGLPALYFGPRLVDYLSMIESSGVGLDITTRTSLGFSECDAIRNEFAEKKLVFGSVACQTTESLDELVSMLKCVVSDNESLIERG